MEADDVAGPSSAKRQRIQVRDPNRLTEEEMLHFLYHSDAEIEDSEKEILSSESEDEEQEDVDVTLAETENDCEIGVSDNQNKSECWTTNACATHQFPFTMVNMMKVDLPESGEPYDYFRLFLDEDLLELIVVQTNIYAREVFCDTVVSDKSRITSWKDITVDELLCFIGLTYHMGTIKLNRVQDYWKKHRLFNFNCFSSFMSRDRYLLILRCLHFAKNPEDGSLPEDRLYKIRPLINHFNTKMNQLYYPGKNLSLDESMVLWRGRLLFKQYIKNKRHKYGLKLYMLTEPDGLVLNFAVYTGQLDDYGGKGHAQKVVLHLMKEKLENGHSLFMDNYYNSNQLAQTLIGHKTYCTGTLRKDRRDIPKDVVTAKLKKGESKSMYRNGVMVAKWKDKRDVLFLSTEFKNDMVLVKNRRGQEKEKPFAVAEYNRYMSGVDRQDQLMSYYPSTRKTLRWYKKLAIHILQMLLHNSFMVFNKFSGKKMTLYDFRLSILERLLPEKEDLVNVNKRKTKASEHLPVKIDRVDSKGKTLRKKCRVCSQKKIWKDTIYHCPQCSDLPGLCLEKCFKIYHK